MKKILKIFLIFIFCIVIYGLSKNVQANSKIENLTVLDMKKEYNTLSSWDKSGTLSSKTEKEDIKYKESKFSFSNFKKNLAKILLEGWHIFIPILVITVSAIIKHSKEYNISGKIYPQNENYYEDIPLNGDIFKVYYIAKQYKLVKNKTDILGAIILKWLKEDIIKVENRGNSTEFRKEDNVIILGYKYDTEAKLSTPEEVEIYDMMYEASKDGILENKEFEQWCKESYYKILGWFSRILREQREILAKEGLVTYKDKNFLHIKKYTATKNLNNEAMKIAGLRKYLLDYTLIKDRKTIEIDLFEDYLIYAQILGITKQVQKQFTEIYPHMIEKTKFDSYDNLVYIIDCASRGVNEAESAQTAATDN